MIFTSPRRRRLNSAQREELYRAESLKSVAAGLGEYPICNLDFCGLAVLPGQDWDESHVGVPAAMGGTVSGIAHRRCNRLHGAKVVTPFVAKTKRLYHKRRGFVVSQRPMPGGRDDPLKIKMNRQIVLRATGEKA